MLHQLLMILFYVGLISQIEFQVSYVFFLETDYNDYEQFDPFVIKQNHLRHLCEVQLIGWNSSISSKEVEIIIKLQM